MNEIPVVKVPKELEQLFPTFMADRRRDVDILRAALAADDLEMLRRLAHRMRGVGNPYGFAYVAVVGKGIEDGARRRDTVALSAQINVYSDYLAKVQVIYD
jgi:HPt (histidine-containing phosphotransfer) domain-containing protein